MSEVLDVVFNIIATLPEETVTSITELNRLYTTYLALARRMGLPENVMDAMIRLQQLRVSAEMAYRSILLLYGASGPIGWAVGLGGLVLSAVTLADQMSIRRGY